MHIGEILNAVYDEDVGWRPVSGTTKPVHVANGLARALQGRHFDTGKLHRFLVWWKKKSGPPDPNRTFDAILADDRDGVFRDFRGPEFDKARRYALGILGADKALFPSAEHSSFSLTCGPMATRDNNDRGLGEFAAQLLGSVSRPSSLGAVVLESLSADVPRDPVTALVWPLLSTEGKESKRNERPRKALKQRHNKAILAQLSEAATALATHERAQGNRLRTLQRAVQFACVATHVHAQALAAGGDLRERPPALIAMSGHRRSEVARASERSLDRIYERFELWLGERLGERIALGKPLAADEDIGQVDTVNTRKLRQLFARIGVAGSGHGEPDREIIELRAADLDVARQEFPGAKPAHVLAHALVAAYVRENVYGGPRSFLQGLGRRIGLLYPHFQGRPREKRVRPSVPVLDMIVRACVPVKTQVPLDDFFERLWMRFGLIVGGRRSEEWDDASLLNRHNLSLDTDFLEQNTAAFVEELVALGLARRYADHVTFVGDGYGT